MGSKQYGFSKKEKLTGKKKIEGLFRQGSSFYFSAFQIRFTPASDQDHHEVLVTVPKKNFKRAVDRNLLKRRIREAFRLNKQLIKDSHPSYIGFVYISKEILTFHEIQNQLITVLGRLKNKMKD